MTELVVTWQFLFLGVFLITREGCKLYFAEVELYLLLSTLSLKSGLVIDWLSLRLGCCIARGALQTTPDKGSRTQCPEVRSVHTFCHPSGVLKLYALSADYKSCIDIDTCVIVGGGIFKQMPSEQRTKERFVYFFFCTSSRTSAPFGKLKKKKNKTIISFHKVTLRPSIISLCHRRCSTWRFPLLFLHLKDASQNVSCRLRS